MSFLIRIVVNAFAIWIVTLIPALQVSVIAFAPGETLQLVLTLLLVGLIFGLVNTIIGTVVKVTDHAVTVQIEQGSATRGPNGFAVGDPPLGALGRHGNADGAFALRPEGRRRGERQQQAEAEEGRTTHVVSVWWML